VTSIDEKNMLPDESYVFELPEVRFDETS
jgi:hypothetical protein